MSFSAKFFLLVSIHILFTVLVFAQPPETIKWSKDGNSYFAQENGNILQYTLPGNSSKLLITKDKLIPNGLTQPLYVRDFFFSKNMERILIYTNTKKVWREDTRGDYWVLDLTANSLKQLGKSYPASSLMFAKFSPDASKVAYVSDRNIYVEDLQTNLITQLTFDGNRKLINGTFDWAYEEELFCRDGFRWSPDSKSIAYWQIDARKVKDYLMIDNIDSIYPFAVPVEYPVAGQDPSPYKIGIVNIDNPKTLWMDIPGDPRQHYLPRMEWAGNSNEIIIQQLNRKQNESCLMICNASNGSTKMLYEEKDEAWIDILPLWNNEYTMGGWDWINNGKEFLWASEKDGWRHLYRISRDGKKETLITNGSYDIMDSYHIDEAHNLLYFMASPGNATQKYLYRIKLDGKGKAEKISPATQEGTHNYDISPNAKYAIHGFSNYYTPPVYEWISLDDHKVLNGSGSVDAAITNTAKSSSNVEFFKVTSSEGIEMDGWMAKPTNFDPAKKYPVVFLVYTEPWGQEVKDQYNINANFLYRGNMAEDGYIYMSIDNRGTPVPKGRAWRKVVYRKIGITNIRDQALAAREILKWPYIDSSRIAVWGWSGGGSATLNLMFQFPDIYKTGIAVAAVGNQLTYDNIYQERYMGLPQENKDDFIKGSPITYAKNLKGNLLYIHGTGDDNVHFQNAEMLVNELIKYNKQFQLMIYPNRTHSISEGKGTLLHLSTLYTNFLKKNCPPGGR